MSISVMRVARTYLAASFNAAYNEMKGVNDTPMPPSNVGFNLYATLHCTHTDTHTHRDSPEGVTNLEQ